MPNDEPRQRDSVPEHERPPLYSKFWTMIGRNWQLTEINYARTRQVEGFITDAVDSITDYVRSVGDRRADGGWSWS